MALEDSYSTASGDVQSTQELRQNIRKINREVKRARATGRASRFLMNETERRIGVSQAVDSSGKTVSVLNVPGIGITDMNTGKPISAMLLEDPINKKGGSAAANPPSLPTAQFDVCENGVFVIYTLYGYKSNPS